MAEMEAEAKAAQAMRAAASADDVNDQQFDAFGCESQPQRPNIIQNLEDMQAEPDRHSEQQPLRNFQPFFQPIKANERNTYGPAARTKQRHANALQGKLNA